MTLPARAGPGAIQAVAGSWIFLAPAALIICLGAFAINHEVNASPIHQTVSPIGPPFAAARLTPTQAIEAIKAQNNGVLFRYAKSVTAQFGSYNLGLYQKATDALGRPVRSTRLLSPTQDYWAVTLTGLDKDSSGNYLLMGNAPPVPGPMPAAHNITFVVDDETGKMVMAHTW